MASKLVDEAYQHDAVEHGDTGQGDESNGGGNGEGHVAYPECHDTAGGGQRHAEEDKRRLARAAETRVDEAEDQQERGGDDDHEAGARGLEILELTAELVEVARRKLHAFVELRLRLLHETFGIATAHVDEDRDAALRILAVDRADPVGDGDVGDALKRHVRTFAADDWELSQTREVEALRLRQTHHDIVAFAAVDQRAGFFAAKGGADHGVDFVGVQVEPLQGFALRGDFEHRHAAECLKLHVASARHAAQQVAGFRREALQLGVIVAVDFQRQVGACAGHNFVEPHLDRLGEEIRLARCGGHEFLAHELDQLGLGDFAAVHLAPFIQRREEEVGVGNIWPHRVGRDFRRADTGEDMADLGKLLHEELFGRSL